MMNPAQIEQKLEAAFDAMHGLQAENRDYAIAAAEAKVEYETAFARALLFARDRGLAVEAAKAEATISTADAYRQSVVKEAEYRANRSAISTLGTQVDILRSLAASHRSLF
jgi:hypothetical protein